MRNREVLLRQGERWRRRKDGRLFDVVWTRNGLVQIKPHEAKNLKNTLWIDEENLPKLYEPADAPPPPSLAERVTAEIAPPEGAYATISATLAFPLSVGPEGWAQEAVAFVRRYQDASWKWFNVPGNEKRRGQGWFALDVYATHDGVKLHLDGPGGWTQVEAKALQESLAAAKKESTPPTPEPDHRCPRCTFGWRDDA